MKPVTDDKEFFGKLRADKPECFWKSQRAGIMGAIARRRAPVSARHAWALAPAFAALLLAAVWLFRHEPVKQKAPQAPAAVASMLENLDMLDNMELLQRIPEKELI